MWLARAPMRNCDHIVVVMFIIMIIGIAVVVAIVATSGIKAMPLKNGPLDRVMLFCKYLGRGVRTLLFLPIHGPVQVIVRSLCLK